MTPPLRKLPEGFAKGQRVKPTAKYRRIYPRSKVQEGIVMAGAMYGRGVRVLFDGQRAFQYLDPTFLERISDGPAPT